MHRKVTLGLLLVALAATASAQTDARYLLDVRQLARTETGERVWEPYEPVECRLCEGEKKVPCRACRDGDHAAADNCAECRGKQRVPCPRCAGDGEALDPFVEIPCPSCTARVRIPCRICSGVGRLDVVGGGTPSCVPCGARGGHRCSTCRGRRRIAVLRIDRTPLHEADLEALVGLAERIEPLHAHLEEFLELVNRRRPKPPRPAELVEPFEELMSAAAELDRVWRGEPRALEQIADSLRKYDPGGTFTIRNLDHPTTIRLEYRRSAEGLLRWIAFYREALDRCMRRHRPEGRR